MEITHSFVFCARNFTLKGAATDINRKMDRAHKIYCAQLAITTDVRKCKTHYSALTYT